MLPLGESQDISCSHLGKIASEGSNPQASCPSESVVGVEYSLSGCETDFGNCVLNTNIRNYTS